jgi:YcxB-like protein
MSLQPMAFDILVTPADLTAWSIQFDSQKSVRRRRLRNTFITMAILPAIALMALFIFWIGDPHRVPLGESWRFAAGIVWETMGLPIGIIWGLALVGLIFRRRMVAAQMNALAKMAPADAQPVHVSFGEDGIDYAEPHVPTRIGWAGIKRWEESSQHFFIVINMLRAFIIPKRDLAATQIQAITQWLTTYAPNPQPQ